MHVLIPAGGRGIRLRPLTNEQPKPLLSLGGRPILTRILDALPADLPVSVLVTPELEPDFRRWQATVAPPRDVRLYVERPRSVGPAGPVAALVDCVRETGIDDDLLILMGDSLLPFTLQQFMAGNQEGCPRLAAYPLPEIKDASRFGVVEIGEDETVASFEEKPAAPRSRWIYTGCFRIPQRLLPIVQNADPAVMPQMGHLVGRFLELGQAVEVFRVQGTWHDIGTFDSYLEAHRAFMTSGQDDRLSSAGNCVEGVVYVHPSARVTRSKLRNCIVLDGASVVDADLTNCIVQPRVSITERVIQGMLITPEAELTLGALVGCGAPAAR